MTLELLGTPVEELRKTRNLDQLPLGKGNGTGNRDAKGKKKIEEGIIAHHRGGAWSQLVGKRKTHACY